MTGKRRKLTDEVSTEQLVTEVKEAIDQYLYENRESYIHLVERVYFEPDGSIYLIDVDGTPAREYKNEEEFLADLERVLKEDYRFDPSSEYLGLAGKKLHNLLAIYI